MTSALRWLPWLRVMQEAARAVTGDGRVYVKLGMPPGGAWACADFAASGRPLGITLAFKALDLSTRLLTGAFLHEVGHLVNGDSIPGPENERAADAKGRELRDWGRDHYLKGWAWLTDAGLPASDKSLCEVAALALYRGKLQVWR